jgi:hypothetical protein
MCGVLLVRDRSLNSFGAVCAVSAVPRGGQLIGGRQWLGVIRVRDRIPAQPILPFRVIPRNPRINGSTRRAFHGSRQYLWSDPRQGSLIEQLCRGMRGIRGTTRRAFIWRSPMIGGDSRPGSNFGAAHSSIPCHSADSADSAATLISRIPRQICSTPTRQRVDTKHNSARTSRALRLENQKRALSLV